MNLFVSVLSLLCPADKQSFEVFLTIPSLILLMVSLIQSLFTHPILSQSSPDNSDKSNLTRPGIPEIMGLGLFLKSK